MHHPDELYRPWEMLIDSWVTLRKSIDKLTDEYPRQRLLWRGARNSSWGVESSLFRALRSRLKRPPTEDQMVAAEANILALAREQWRFDHLGALETFAHLQHLGGPTRLLDVTENPLIAAWFATQDGEPVEEPGSPADSGGTDARLFAFVTPERDIRLNARWGGRDPWWHDPSNGDDDRRRKNKWGTGKGRRYWRPPAYDTRISAQSAGFLLDGVPISSSEHGFGRKAPDTEETWTAQEMRAFGSIPLKLTSIRRGTLAPDAAPVFTYRIAASAVPEIRTQLENRYGYGASSIYSDLYGLAQYLAQRPSVWTPTP